MADEIRKEEAARALGTPAATIEAAFGPNFETWQHHVIAHVPLPDPDGDGHADMGEPVVPILLYGDGPRDYIVTDVDAGQVIVRDANQADRPWKFPLIDLLRFVAHSQGKRLAGDPEPQEGDNPYQAAAKQQARTNRLVQGERDAAEAARQAGESSTPASNRAAADKAPPAGKK